MHIAAACDFCRGATLSVPAFTEPLTPRSNSMKRSLKVNTLAVALIVSSTFVSADTIQLGSFATGASSLGNANTAVNFAGFSSLATPSVGTGTSFTLNPSNVWAGACPEFDMGRLCRECGSGWHVQPGDGLLHLYDELYCIVDGSLFRVDRPIGGRHGGGASEWQRSAGIRIPGC